MNIGQFIAKVKSMRKAQKEYFRFRSKGWLERAKANEKEVDDMLAEYYEDESKQCRFDF